MHDDDSASRWTNCVSRNRIVLFRLSLSNGILDKTLWYCTIACLKSIIISSHRAKRTICIVIGIPPISLFFCSFLFYQELYSFPTNYLQIESPVKIKWFPHHKFTLLWCARHSHISCAWQPAFTALSMLYFPIHSKTCAFRKLCRNCGKLIKTKQAGSDVILWIGLVWYYSAYFKIFSSIRLYAWNLRFSPEAVNCFV